MAGPWVSPACRALVLHDSDRRADSNSLDALVRGQVGQAIHDIFHVSDATMRSRLVGDPDVANYGSVIFRFPRSARLERYRSAIARTSKTADELLRNKRRGGLASVRRPDSQFASTAASPE